MASKKTNNANKNDLIEEKDDSIVFADADSLEDEIVETEVEAAPKKGKAKKQEKPKSEKQLQKEAKLAEKQRIKEQKAKEKAENDDGEPKISDIFKMIAESTKKKKKKKEPVVVQKIKRVKTDYQTGLTAEQVEERKEKGHTNATPNTNSKTVGSIICENVFTFFNILCFIVFIALVVVNIMYKQKWSNVLFMLIILVNIVIGIVQEIRAKKTIEKLSLLTAPVVKVVRDRVEENIATEEVVIDDIVVLSTGKQIVADCIVVEGNIEVNESVLTGESLPIKKKVGDTLLAGSFVVAGHCHARVEKVGVNNYIQQLSASAKKYKKPKSELFNSLKLIIKVIGILIVPITILMVLN
ncbi:MAG: HAD-IC family P-type ATPase, partial [Clostridia bacterium]|nr:HAD-IC family P-type ATPase [Clostridia bacterium]